jgi:hypothetical protein
MMKRFSLITILGILSFTIMAQSGESALPRGNKQLNLGLGFNTHGFPIYAGLDFAVHNNVTLGPLLKIRFDDNNTSVILVGRVDFHWNQLMGIPSNWDFYTGGNLGARFRDGIYLDLGLQIGGRWYFSDKLGINLEFGGGRGFGTLLGISIRL